MLRGSMRVLSLVVLAVVGTAWSASGQVLSGTVAGTVTDSTGGVVPGASVMLTSEAQARKIGPVITNAEGAYVFPNIIADTYTVDVSLSGFKTVSRTGIRVSGGARVSVATIVLEAGGVTAQVDVKAEAPLVKAASGERSSAIEKAQLDSLPVSSHAFLDFVGFQTGINSGSMNPGNQMRRVGGGGQDNIMLDGISALDTGNNGLMSGMNMPVEAIAEVQVLTSGYSAEYGRSSGLQVSGVTRSGTNRFTGTVYDYERNSDWNANTWARTLNGQAKTVQRERDWGYSIGGPVGKPGGENKLFFFYTQEFRPRQTGNNTNNFRMPTAEERRGDFSKTQDNNGALYNLIYDASTGQPKSNCSATIQTACFQDGGVVGKIPVSRLYGPGLALLNQYPLPNGTQQTGQNYNHTITTPVQNTLGYTPVVKVDYQWNQNLRLSWKINSASARIVPGLGSLPGYTDTLQKFPGSYNTSWTANYSLTPTTFFEGTFGINQNRLGSPSISEYSNRYNVKCPADLAAQVANCSLGAIPLLFPDAGKMNPDYYEAGALPQVGSPFFVNGEAQLPPQWNWGTTRIGSTPPSINYPGFMNINRITQGTINMTKVMGNHTAKAGIYIEHSYKAQNTGGNLTFQGALNFGVDTNNPLDSQMAFSNAALGIFSTYGQGSQFIEGNFFYNNIEWYVQDNWKVNRKLTLDYGLRFAHDGPYEDKLKQVANFFPEKWSKASAPALYVAGCVGNVNPCSGNNRQAKDPRTGQLMGLNTVSLIGSVIPGSGNSANGMVRAGDGISNAGYTWPSLVVGPRFGAAYDMTGDQKMVLRGSVGLYFDRPDGNTAFGTVANPPTAAGITQQWGRLAELGQGGLSFGPVPQIVVNQYDSAIPKDTQWNVGVQRALPWSSSIDVSYVGHHAFDVLGGTQNGNAVNLNAIDVGTTLTQAGLDPTLSTPTAQNNNLLRPFQGYGNINVQMAQFYRTFHSLQFNFTRRFRNGLSFGVNDTWTLYDKGNTNLPGPQVRLIHAADGSYSVSPDQAIAEELFGDQGTTTHIMTANFVWDMPDLPKSNGTTRAIGYVVNDWQLSGIFRGDSGGKYDVGYSYNSGATGQALTGSPDYSARVVLKDVSALGSGCSSDQYAQLKNTLVPATGGLSPFMSTAIAGPQIGSRGLESSRFNLTGCKDHRLDVALQRNIRVGGGKMIVFRADIYNVFKAVVINGRQSTLQMNSTTDQTVRNSQFLADGSVDPARLLPNNAGFGAATGAADSFNGSNALRSVQLQIKFVF